MSTFDPKAFAQGLIEPVRLAVAPFLTKAGADAKELLADVDALERSTESTLAALAVVGSAERVADLLRDDLAKFLPARKAAILARAANLLATDLQGALEATLTVVEKAAIIAAKAFI